MKEQVDEIDHLDENQKKICNEIENTNKSLLLLGQAGTGKSTIISYLKRNTKKNIIVVSPTAVGAVNVGGSTIHSVFMLPPSDYFIKTNLSIKNKTKKILRVVDTIILDECSMVNPNLFDTIEYICQNVRKNTHSFGGIQMVLIGDLMQLPPVINNAASFLYEREYGHRNAYFFDAKCFNNPFMPVFKIYFLEKIYRQNDPDLLKNLTRIRNSEEIEEALEYFNECKITSRKRYLNSTIITPYRITAEDINAKKLNEIKEKEFCYEAECSGTFLTIKETPATRTLKLKKGALVMFSKNSVFWHNGSLGIIDRLQNNVISVTLLKDNETYDVTRENWQNFAYDFDITSNEIKEKVVGTFCQFPLQLGYASTIHKAQGKTLENVIIDCSQRGMFSHGQLYVALSRIKTKEGLHISSDLKQTDVIVDERIINFLEGVKKNNEKNENVS